MKMRTNEGSEVRSVTIERSGARSVSLITLLKKENVREQLLQIQIIQDKQPCSARGVKP